MSKFLKKAIIFGFVTVAARHQSNAQGTNNPINKITIASPTAAGLGKYGDIPVNYHTGIPQISIPIYTVSAGPLSLPVSLSYHASGLKVQEPASWVGAGWSLNAGGVITRSVMGGPDEKGTNNGMVENHGHFSDYGYHNYIRNGGSPGYNGVLWQDWAGILAGREDGEPDLFFFNFDGTSGKFYFRDDRTPVIVPEADFKIEPNYTENTNSSIQSFTITASDGTKYYFGNTPGLTGTAPVEITKPVTDGNGMSTANTISSWYLNRITSSDGLFTITLNYQTENYGYHTISMFPINGDAVPTGNMGTFGNTHGYDLIKNVIQGVRLSQIVSPNGKINFVAAPDARADLSDNFGSLNIDNVNTTAKALGSIEIADVNNTVLKKFNLTYNYFEDNNTPIPQDIANFAPNLTTDRKRLKLEQVKEFSADETQTKPPHVFTYFNEQVPRRLSFSIDHWGFINGVNSNTTPIPSYTKYGNNITTNYPGADRDTYWPAMRAGTLQQINYPTGGYSLFEFEPNTVYSSATSNVNTSILYQFVRLYGQAAFSNTTTFVSSPNAPNNVSNMAFNNMSNYSATFTITDANNTVVYNTFIGNGQSVPVNPITLPYGTYTATLSLPTASTGGCTVSITQWQTVTTNNTIPVGGNRIKTISHNDGVTVNNIITAYNYNDDNNNLSSGILYNRPAYVGIVRNDFLRDNGGFLSSAGFEQQWYAPNGCISAPDAQYFKSPTSIRPMASTQGNHIGYSQVKVSQSGNGFSKYTYFGSTGTPPWQQTTGDVVIRTVNVQGCDNNAPSYPYAPVPFDYLRGELKQESQYNEAGQKLREVNYTHNYANSTIKTPALLVAYLSTGSQSGWTFATPYDLATAKKTQTQVAETVYNPTESTSQSSTSTTYFESPFHNQPTRITAINSKNETIETKTKYVNDFRIAACDNISDGYSQYTTDCSSCLTTYNNTRTQTNCVNNMTCLTTAFLTYEKCLSDARITYVNYRKTNFTNLTPILNTFQTNHNTAKTNALSELKPILQLQDNFENPAIETSKWKNGNLLSASFSRYDFATVPAKVYLNKVQAINIAAPSATFTAAATNAANTSITKDSRYIDETTAKFYEGNLAEITAKDGVTTSYLWGHNNQLPIAKAIGTTQAALLTAYTAVGGNLSQLRNQFPSNTIQLNTYEYIPAIGMTKETDVNGKSITYEYDKLQRLLLARDFNNNIIKQYDYQYQASVPNTIPQWVATGNNRCEPCPANANYNTGNYQYEEKDNNPYSPTYNTLRYVNDYSVPCIVFPDWHYIGSPYCIGNYEFRDRIDVNPCSSSYNTVQAAPTFNNTACGPPPPPPTCNGTTCFGNDKKCINNVCETGTKVYTASVYKPLPNLWICTYHYVWSDNTISQDYTESSPTTCL